MWYDTQRVILTAGAAAGGTSLNAFDNALREGSIADFNLIKVSSIIPVGIPIYYLKKGAELIKGDGRMVPTIFETIESQNEGEEIAAAVGIGISEDNSGAGIGFVCSLKGTKEEAEKLVEEMVVEGMEAKGLPHFKCLISADSIVVKKPWSCVIAAAVFCDPDIETLFKPESYILAE